MHVGTKVLYQSPGMPKPLGFKVIAVSDYGTTVVIRRRKLLLCVDTSSVKVRV